MKITKKLLSILLAVLMLATTLAVAAVPAQAYSTIQFGNYPQTKVTATTALSNAAANATWKSYGYYIGNGSYDGSMTASDYMKYADFFSGGVKYRAVKFTQYRPELTRYTSSASNSYQDDNGYYTNTTYYFKYEPLTWRVLDASTGLVLCDSIIDAQAYQNVVRNSSGDYYVGTTSTYANNWVESTVMRWLENDFYNTAFNAAQKGKIKRSGIQNNAYSSGYYQYDANPTAQNIYLLSYSEAQNSSYGFPNYTSSDTSRKAKGTDYAKCQGLYVASSGFSNWELRTAGKDSLCICVVGKEGAVINNHILNSTSIGVRPACKLSSLTSDITMADVYMINAFVNSSAGGTVTGAGTYGKGENVTLTATPKYGYNFTGWYNGTTRVTTNTSYSFTVSADAAYTANFSPKNYTVTANSGTGGSVTGSGSYTYNTSATVKATPNPGYKFSGWFDGNTKVSSSANYSFNVTKNVTLTAQFELNPYTITVNADTGGTVTGGGSYLHGNSVTVTATPNSGYHFVGWFNGNNKVNDSAGYSFTVTEDVTLTAKFEKDAAPDNPNQPDNPGGGNDQPQQPDNPGNGSDNGGAQKTGSCKYCGEDHTGFLGFFVKIFHSILALFGLRKK